MQISVRNNIKDVIKGLTALENEVLDERYGEQDGEPKKFTI